MSEKAPLELTTIVINLHESAAETVRLMQMLELDPKTVEADERDESSQLHQYFTDDDLCSLFPKSGLRRLQSPRFVIQLLQAGFSPTHPRLVVGRAGKMYTQFGFLKNPKLPPLPHTGHLARVLGQLIWKRSRATMGRTGNEHTLIVDLVQLQKSPTGKLNELRFHPVIGLDYGPLSKP